MADKELSLPPVASENNKLITVLNDNDVLLGRGTGPSQFIGNQRFRAHAGMYRKCYVSASQNKEKKRVAGELFNFIHLLGGRFLKKVGKVDIVDNAVWCEADEEVALEKCKQTLRDHVEKEKEGSNDETYLSLLAGSQGNLNINSYIGTGPLAMPMNERSIDEQKLLMTRILLQQYQQHGAVHESLLASSSGSIVRVAPPDSLDFSLTSHSSLSTMNKNNGGHDLKPSFLPARHENTEEGLPAAPLRGTMPKKVGHPAGPSSPSRGLFPPVGSEARGSSFASTLGSVPYSLVADRQGLDPRMQALRQQCQQMTNGSLAYHSFGLESIPQLRPDPGLDRLTHHHGTRLVGDMTMQTIGQVPLGASQASDPSLDPAESEEDHVTNKTYDDDKVDKKPQFQGITESFPEKLYRMLEEAEEYGHDDILSFSPDGGAFKIHKPCKFLEDIMPRYFSTTCMSSFDHQLSLYGFRRAIQGRDKGYYCHKFFLKGRKGLVKKINRKGPVRPMPIKQEHEESIRGYRREMAGAGVGLRIPALTFTTQNSSTKEVIEEAIRAYQREISDADGIGLGFSSSRSTIDQNLLAQRQMINSEGQLPPRLGNNLSRLPPSIMGIWTDPGMQFGNAAVRSLSFAAGNGLRVDPTTAILLEEHNQSELRIAQLQQRRQQMSDLFHLIS